MDAKELRIGNIVIKEWQEGCKETFIMDAERIPIVEKYPERFHPIELSPEILGKAGFMIIYGKCWTNDAITIDVFTDGVFEYYYTDDRSIEIKYLHQLQNLFYSLTGTELEINLQQ